MQKCKNAKMQKMQKNAKNAKNAKMQNPFFVFYWIFFFSK
jgi:hypothetical protein